MIDIAMLTAPRQEPTLKRSLLSLREAGFKQAVHLFAEPGSELQSLPETDPHLVIHQNPERMGCFHNYNQGLEFLLQETESPYVMVLLDDMIYSRYLAPYLLETLKKAPPEFGYYALISIDHDIGGLKGVKPGWNRSHLGWYCWGGLFVMQRETAARLVQFEFYRDHLLYYTRNQQIDACVSESFKRMELAMFMHIPSLAEHIGETSTLGHGELTDERRAFQFQPSLPPPDYFPIAGA